MRRITPPSLAQFYCITAHFFIYFFICVLIRSARLRITRLCKVNVQFPLTLGYSLLRSVDSNVATTKKQQKKKKKLKITYIVPSRNVYLLQPSSSTHLISDSRHTAVRFSFTCCSCSAGSGVPVSPSRSSMAGGEYERFFFFFSQDMDDVLSHPPPPPPPPPPSCFFPHIISQLHTHSSLLLNTKLMGS